MHKSKLNRLTGIDIINYLIISMFSLFCLLPMLLLLTVSFTDEEAIVRNGYQFIPEKFSLAAYQTIFHSGESIVRSYAISVFITVVGTAIAVLITGMGAFTLSNKSVKFRNKLSFYFYFTMLFSAGLVPWYMMCRALNLYNNIFALLIPNLIFNPFNLFLVRNYMLGIPNSLMESAKIDGANEIVIAFKIYFPLSVPVLAAVTLFYALGYWNDWWNSIMLVDNKNLFPLQYLLFKLQSELQMLRDLQMSSVGGAGARLPSESVKMATVILTIGPIVFLYPFLQRYFIKGLIIGGVKG